MKTSKVITPVLNAFTSWPFPGRRWTGCDRQKQTEDVTSSRRSGLLNLLLICGLLVCLGTPVFGACTPAAYEAVINGQSPSAWFKLNGDYANAETGNTLGAHSGNTFGADYFGNANSAYSFSSAADKLTLAPYGTSPVDAIGGGGSGLNSAATGQGSITMLFRALSVHPSGKLYLLSQGTSTTAGNRLAVYFDGANGLKVQVGNDTEETILADGNLVLNAWYYLAVTCKEDRDGDEVHWYLGRIGYTLTSGTFEFNNPDTVFGDNGDITIGNEGGSATGAYQQSGPGLIDQVAFWTSELTDSQIKAQFSVLPHPPSVNFDLTRWNLLLPVDSLGGFSGAAYEIQTAQLNASFEYVDPSSCEKKYFFTGADGAMVFQAPYNGAVENGGDPRSEFRETKLDGSDNNWAPSAGGVHILDGVCAVNAAGVGKVIIGQIHSKAGVALPVVNVPAVTLYYDNRVSPPLIRVTVKHDPDNKTASAPETIHDFAGVPLNGRIQYQLKLVGGTSTVQLYVTVNGVTWYFNMYEKDTDWSATTLYFKAGCYYPVAQDGVTAQVSFYKLAASYVPIHHVWSSSPSPGSPYSTWTTAAHDVQTAVDAASAGDYIYVTNGTYSSGSKQVGGQTIYNRVALDKAVRVESVYGPAVTTIQGYKVPSTVYGDSAIRCVYLASGSTLTGFTLTGGATRNSGDYSAEQSGGGAWCASSGVTVNYCIFDNNAAVMYGGGAFSAPWPPTTILNNCVFTGNTLANNVGYGGGVYRGVLNQCTLTGNSAPWSGGGSSYGGGAEGSFLDNCILTGNSAFEGGGADGSKLTNCTVVGNSSEAGGGVGSSWAYNSIVWGNTASSSANFWGSWLEYSCTTPSPTGTPDSGGANNITSDPSFVDAGGGNLRLAVGSPCFNAGNNAYAPRPFSYDGYGRIVGSAVDMGAYETFAKVFTLDTPGHSYESGYRAQGFALSRLPGTGTLVGGTVEGQGYNPVGVGLLAMVRDISTGSDGVPGNLCSCVPDEFVLGIADGWLTGIRGAHFTPPTLPLHYPWLGTITNGWTKQLCAGGVEGEARGISPLPNFQSEYAAVGLFAKTGGYGAFYQKLSDTTQTELPGLSSSTINMANAVNESKLFVGASAKVNGTVLQTNAIFWKSDGSAYTNCALPRITGAASTASCEALGINAAGSIVGYCYKSIYKRPCVWLFSGTKYQAFELTAVSATAHAQANNIDENGLIVGTCLDGSALRHACLWQDGTRYELKDQIRSYTGNIPNDTDSRNFDLQTAAKINSSGMISGTFYNNTWGQSRIYLLAPY